MTTTAGFASLQAPAPEDSMEMSSPAQQTYDDDIDIDFEDPVGVVELTEDERMVEDSEQQRPATATDDMMEDDAPEVHVPEQEMQDDFDAAAYEQADPDDELIDYGDDEYQDMTNFHEQDQDVYEQQAPEINIEDREPSEAGYELVGETAAREHGESAPEPVAAVAEETVTESVHPSVDLAAVPVAVEDSETAVVESPTGGETTQNEPENALAASEEGDVAPQTADGQDEPESTTQHAEETFLEQPNESPEEESTVAQVPAPLNTSLEAATDAPGTPTDTGLHPMIVRYGDWEWPLFKSRKQPTGLLKDDNLASVALADLLNNCRYRLAMKAGEDISEDQEFVLRFDGTGLTIVENTPSAFNTSLDEILEVYKQLHINDGAQTIPPFWLHLSLQPKFSSYLTMLKQAAAGGQGMSSFIDVSAGESAEQFGEYGEEAEDADNDPTMLGNEYTEDYQDQAEYQGHEATADPELTETDYREYDTSYEATEGDHEGDHEAEDGYDQYDDAAYANYDENDEGFNVNAPAEGTEPTESTEHLDESHHHEEPAAAADESHQDDEKDDTDLAHGSVQPTHASSTAKVEGTMPEGNEEPTIESAASSTTLRPDQANDVTGEYKDDDLIDWDDSTLTSNYSEHGLDDTDDFSTFLAESDAEAFVDESHVGDDVDGNADATLNEIRVGDDADGALSNVENANVDTNDTVNVTVHKDTTVANESSAHEDDAKAPSMREAQVVDQAQQLGEHAQDDFSVDDAEASADKAALSNGDHRGPEAQSEAERRNGEAPQDGVSHVATEGQEAGHEDASTIQPSAADEDYIDFDNEDDIDFDDDTYEQHEARKASEANSPESKSPSGKRPLDQTDGLDLTEQPELKKVRSS